MTQAQQTGTATAAPPDELSIDDALRMAKAMQQNGDRVSPRIIYERVLAIVPNHPDALHFLGLMAFQEGYPEQARALIERALESAPDYVDAHINLGNLHKEAGRLADAEQHFRRALALRPGSAATLNNLGMTVAQAGRFDEAESLCRAAIAQVPDSAAYHNNLGHILRRTGRSEEALQSYSQSALLDPEARFNRGAQIGALVSLGRVEEAARRCRDWLAKDPHDAFARHHLAACTHTDVPARADDAYVRKMFDGFAGTFDAKLAQLEYRAPQLIGELLPQWYAAADATLDVLDAGCGTGLCAPWLRPIARRLVGVDLSSRMIEVARQRAVYDELEVEELGASLERRVASVDLIVAGDVLCYFGELVPVFLRSAAALRDGGHLVFTVERHAESGDGFTLHPHGRYSHAESYVLQSLREAGLTIEVCQHQVLRMEAARPVDGLLVAARRGSPDHDRPAH